MSSSIILSNINVNFLKRYIRKDLQVEFGDGYNNWLQFFLSQNTTYANVFLILEGQQLYLDYSIDEIETYIDNIIDYCNKNKSICVYISTINCLDVVDHLPDIVINKQNYQNIFNSYLYENTKENTNFYCIDILSSIAKEGIINFYSPKMKYMSSCPFSLLGLERIANTICKSLDASIIPRKKCLVLDLDNTLWGGVIGEDGLDGIQLSDHKEGACYYEFQKAINDIRETGVILCICSKNNVEDVLPVFEHPSMFLKKDDFTIIKSNWNPKSENILNISKELNIGLSSIVFVDDNPIEREEVKKSLPEVSVPDFPLLIDTLPSFGFSLYTDYFYIRKTTSEDLKKNKMYKENLQREELKKHSLNLDDFIKSLNINIHIDINEINNSSRYSQMTQKTNQFNLTTIRMSEQEISHYIESDDFCVYSGKITDRYGDNGTSILAVVQLNHINKTAKIMNFLMSCRIMGRKIEYCFLNYIESHLKSMGYTQIFAEYIPTEKNAPARDFYSMCNYAKNDSGIYIKNITADNSYSYNSLFNLSIKEN